MSTEKLDLRVVRTRKAIKQSFLELLQYKDYERITIQDIAEKAMINRNTFYLHYLDKPDLMEKLYLDYSEKLNVCIDKKPHHIHDLTKEVLIEVLSKLFQVIHSNLSFFKPILTQDGLPSFSFHLKKMLKESIFSGIHDDYANLKLQIRMEYVVSGLSGVICLWIMHSEEYVLDEIIAHVSDLHFDNIVCILTEYE